MSAWLSSFPTSRARTGVAVVVVALACAACLSYRNSLGVPFLFDDGPAIVENRSIRDLTDLGQILFPDLAGGVTTSGRPVLNLSFAVNHQFGRTDVRGYHAVNLAIHFLAALLLFGITRRTCSARLSGRIGSVTEVDIAAAVAALWMLHPLHTSAVTYLAQRAESLCGLFFLATIYTFVRATQSSRPERWLATSVVVCALGMGTKEVMVTAPLLVLLYDRTFVSGSFAAGLRQRTWYYAALAGTWVLLGTLVLATPGRGSTAGFETVVTPWSYLLTQCSAIIHYLRLALWPHPLVFDHGTATVSSLADVWWQSILLVAFVCGTLWAIIRRPAFGFLGAWFLLILAPSSSIVPVASQTVAEHRMYLPLIAVVVIIVIVGVRWIPGRVMFGSLAAAMAVGLGFVTFNRNSDFRSERAIWEDTVIKAPGNPRARINLAQALGAEGQQARALEQLDAALRADPHSADAHYNRGVLLSKMGRKREAVAAYAAAVRSYPEHAEALNNLGTLSHSEGDLIAAEGFLRRALEARPYFSSALVNLSAVLLEIGRIKEGFRMAKAAVDSDPSSAEAAFRLGVAHLDMGNPRDATSAFQNAVDLDSLHDDARINLANLLVESGDFDAALLHYRELLSHRPELIPPRRNTAIILARLGRTSEAIAEFERLAALVPDEPFYREQLTRMRQQPQ